MRVGWSDVPDTHDDDDDTFAEQQQGPWHRCFSRSSEGVNSHRKHRLHLHGFVLYVAAFPAACEL